MRVKSAAILKELTRIVTSAGIGYALGRLQQRAHDEGRVSLLERRLKARKDATLQPYASVVDFLRQREKDVEP